MFDLCVQNAFLPHALPQLWLRFQRASPFTCSTRPRSAMAAHDSKAAFRSEVFRQGLGHHFETFVSLKWTTFARLCFTTSVKPGQDEEIFARDVLVPALGSRDHEDQGLLRRLFYEAYLSTSAGLKFSADPTAADLPRSVPKAELDDRRRILAARLDALTENGKFKGELDCADKLIERCLHIHHRNALAYVGPEWCNKREFDLLGGTKNPVLAPSADSRGYVQMRLAQEEETPLWVCTEIVLQNALMRRGLALDMADILDWVKHEKLRRKLQAAMAKDPQEGFRRVTIEQVISADRLFWVDMDNTVEGKVQRNDDDERPCDLAFDETLKSYDFYMALQPKQGSDAASSRDGAKAPRAPQPSPAASQLSKGDKKTIKKQLKNEELAKLRAKAQLPPKGAQKHQQASAGKGGQKGQQKGAPSAKMPPQLIGMCSKSSAATGMLRLCYGFNLGTCSAASPGKQCMKGLHGCMKPDPTTGEACGGAHPCSSCTK